ncbi:MAG: M28 family peptidase [Bacteroidetes bacterium]|nr:MAG: M28 family peptidase [Bacteroidota bacterium]
MRLYFFSFLFFFSFTIFAQQVDRKSLLEDLKMLSSDEFEGRKPNTKGHQKAKELIKKRFSELKLKTFYTDFEQKFMVGKTPASNLLAYIEGTEKKDQFFVISAHYDHLGIEKGKIYNGADDNASGVSAVLAMASHFSKNPPKYSIIFLMPDAEELGLKGAYHFSKNLPVKKEKLLANINMDMISRNENQEIYACGTGIYPKLQKFFDKSDGHKIKVLFGHDGKDNLQNWTESSDHGAFHSIGVPFVYFGVEDHEDYHESSDDFDKIQPDFYFSVTNYILNTLINMDKNW